jgi:hypothetical protein
MYSYVYLRSLFYYSFANFHLYLILTVFLLITYLSHSQLPQFKITLHTPHVPHSIPISPLCTLSHSHLCIHSLMPSLVVLHQLSYHFYPYIHFHFTRVAHHHFYHLSHFHSLSTLDTRDAEFTSATTHQGLRYRRHPIPGRMFGL